MYVAIVQEMQQIGTATARLIVNEICKLHLCDVPGEDVNTFTNIVYEYCSRLEGVKAVPFDMAGIVAACILKSATFPSNI